MANWQRGYNAKERKDASNLVSEAQTFKALLIETRRSNILLAKIAGTTIEKEFGSVEENDALSEAEKLETAITQKDLDAKRKKAIAARVKEKQERNMKKANPLAVGKDSSTIPKPSPDGDAPLLDKDVKGESKDEDKKDEDKKDEDK